MAPIAASSSSGWAARTSDSTRAMAAGRSSVDQSSGAASTNSKIALIRGTRSRASSPYSALTASGSLDGHGRPCVPQTNTTIARLNRVSITPRSWQSQPSVPGAALGERLDDRPGTVVTHAGQRAPVTAGEPLVVDQGAEHVAVLHERQRIGALAPRGGRQDVACGVYNFDRFAPLVDAFGVARPAGDDRDRAVGRATGVELVPDDRKEELRDPLGGVHAQP